MIEFKKLKDCNYGFILLTDKFENIDECNCVYLNKKYSLSKEKSNVLVLKDIDSLDFYSLEKVLKETERFIKKLKNERYHCSINISGNRVFAIIITNSIENNNVINMCNSINAFLIFDKKKKYNFLYNTVCEYLDSKFVKNNYCEFKDNFCIAKRNRLSKRKEMGCCYRFTGFMGYGKMVLCDKLGDKGCLDKCITCKLFTCNYLKKKFKIKKICLLDYFFNPIQKFIFKVSFFNTKDRIMKKILLWSL